MVSVLRNRCRVASSLSSTDRVNACGGQSMAGSALTCCSMRKALSQLCGARCLKPYPGKPDVRNFRGAAGNVVYGGTAHPPAIERAGPEKPPPKDARASSLPNTESGPVVRVLNGLGDAARRE